MTSNVKTLMRTKGWSLAFEATDRAFFDHPRDGTVLVIHHNGQWQHYNEVRRRVYKTISQGNGVSSLRTYLKSN
jgi:hypothetical protein